uniref:Uncharacterized protein n=1 Tax=Arundo donax TaxID=35708 RepID=A0A0A9DQC4_ARUDO
MPSALLFGERGQFSIPTKGQLQFVHDTSLNSKSVNVTTCSSNLMNSWLKQAQNMPEQKCGRPRMAFY